MIKVDFKMQLKINSLKHFLITISLQIDNS